MRFDLHSKTVHTAIRSHQLFMKYRYTSTDIGTYVIVEKQCPLIQMFRYFLCSIWISLSTSLTAYLYRRTAVIHSPYFVWSRSRQTSPSRVILKTGRAGSVLPRMMGLSIHITSMMVFPQRN